jgi:nitronate monooxygenase
MNVALLAAGRVADARGIAAAIVLGACAAQVGTGFLRCAEAKLPSAWSETLSHTLLEQTFVTRAFSGRPGRSIATAAASLQPMPRRSSIGCALPQRLTRTRLDPKDARGGPRQQ